MTQKQKQTEIADAGTFVPNTDVPTMTAPADKAADEIARVVGNEFKRYLVVSDNAEWSGKICGVAVTNGIGVLDPTTIDTRLGHTFGEIVAEIRQRPGYSLVDTTGQDVMVAIQAYRHKQAEDEAKKLELIHLLQDNVVADALQRALAR